MDGDELLTIKDAARELGVTTMTVRRHIESGDIKYVRPGREYLILRSALEHYRKNKRDRGRPRKTPPADDH